MHIFAAGGSHRAELVDLGLGLCVRSTSTQVLSRVK